MIPLQLKRNLKLGHLLILTLLLLIPVAISYFDTNLNCREWISIYESNACDVDLERVKNRIDGYNGLTYFFDFIFASDAVVVFCLLFSTAICFFIGSSIMGDLSNGNGNLIVSRIGFKKYLHNNVQAQIIFSFTYLATFFTILFFVSYLFYGNLDLECGISTNYDMRIRNGSLLPYLGIMYLQVFNLSIITTSIAILGSLVGAVVKNKYVVQIFPLLYYFIALILGHTMGNVNPTIGNILTIFVMDEQIFSIAYNFFTSYEINISSSIIFVTVLFLINVILYKKNILEFGKDYIA